MKSKYIDEKYKPYFIFGKINGGVCINDGDDDICTVTNKDAEKLISDRNNVLALVHLINEKYPDEFNNCFNALNFPELKQ